ncbi:uncharacterized protein LOC107471226 [Arachis duranensis]|uniref:Uncharacterized protein LOC107471226 n=1 Tax=Arachis duranensis TaxID=130453 RepID=A0A9C6TJ80_ARADU|nr:uncharacterized protein LOC107471226 [Arachis duranensis]XP_052111312.1 uncharacterized protein LOC107471226 [Arachis duranensis]
MMEIERALFLALNADEHSQCELAFLSSLSVASSVSNRSGVTLCDSISRLSIHSLSFLLMRYASASEPTRKTATGSWTLQPKQTGLASFDHLKWKKIQILRCRKKVQIQRNLKHEQEGKYSRKLLKN